MTFPSLLVLADSAFGEFLLILPVFGGKIEHEHSDSYSVKLAKFSRFIFAHLTLPNLCDFYHCHLR